MLNGVGSFLGQLEVVRKIYLVSGEYKGVEIPWTRKRGIILEKAFTGGLTPGSPFRPVDKEVNCSTNCRSSWRMSVGIRSLFRAKTEAQRPARENRRRPESAGHPSRLRGGGSG